jgi:pyridoxine 5-phosphate synthase
VKTKLDLEMAATEEIVRIAIETLPELVTLVPEKRQELTTEGGLDVVGHRNYLQDVIEEFHRHEIEVSLFVDPIAGQIEAAKAIGSDMIEIHTGEYANARTEKEALALLEIVHSAAKLGVELGMVVNAGHGLNYVNIGPITSIEEISEVSIGHAVISRSLFVGLERAVREMKDLMR